MAWEKGQSGNPNGRPKKDYSINERVRRFFESKEADEETGELVERIDLLIKDTWRNARKGDFQAQRYLMDRLGGRPTEKVEISGDENKPLGIVFLPMQKTPEEWINDRTNRKGVESTTETADSP